MFVAQSGASLPGRMNIVFAKLVLKLSLSWHPCLPPAGSNSLHKNACLSRLSSYGLQSLIINWALSGVESEVANLCGSEAEQNFQKTLASYSYDTSPCPPPLRELSPCVGGRRMPPSFLPMLIGRRDFLAAAHIKHSYACASGYMVLS